MYVPNDRWTWSFTLVALFQAIIALALEAYVFGRFEASLHSGASEQSAARTIPTYLSLYIFGFIYELVLVWDALRVKNTIQVIGICLYNVGMLIYSAVKMDQIDDAIRELTKGNWIEPGIWDDLRPFLVAAPAVLALGTVALSFCAWKLYGVFSWDIYKSISADLQLKRRFLVFQVYITLLKLDFFFFLAFTVQFLVIVGGSFKDAEIILTIIAIPVTIIILWLAAVVTRRESYAGQACIIVIYFAAMAYFIFKLFRMYDNSNPEKVLEYYPARKSLTTFAVLTILLLVVTIVTAGLCTKNFNKGLAPHVRRRKIANPEDSYKPYPSAHDLNNHPMGPVPNRMTID
ncbi:hypothetical protein B0A48_03658 [Cryoendolithus antarcticus]|uniref:Uncharacterized protein n=1 Tax=Cryoendolithus antarcticus TaxID=1507870 RepID=A0A1V8TL04_9PEZI|nr:hypothetical protein B0A48_03658 [Cryoendolithus antarcticus]